MTPEHIVSQAIARGLHLIAITDHNAMRQCREVQLVGREKGLTVWCGVEINTREEVHCLAYFESPEEQLAFQHFLDLHLPNVPNHPLKFGDQVWVDRHENILGSEPRLLIMGLMADIDQVAAEVKRLNGIFIAAHVDRPYNSIISQLGFIDERLPFDAIELSAQCNRTAFLANHPQLARYPVITSSDAHCPDQIGTSPFVFQAPDLSFGAFRLMLAHLPR